MAETTKKTKPDTVKVRLPRRPAGAPQYELVGLNGKLYQIPCGKEVEISADVNEILMRQQAARDALMDVQESLPNEG